jgi:hypothetical protein
MILSTTPGGAIIFGLNNNIDSTGGVSLQTYLVIIGIMCAGPFISLLLSHPEKVQRKDGVKIVFRKTGWTQTLTEWWKIVCSPDVSLIFMYLHLLLISVPDSSPVPPVLHFMVLWVVYRHPADSVHECSDSCTMCIRHSIR